MEPQCCVHIFVVILCLVPVTAGLGQCGEAKGIRHVKFPGNEKLLSMAEFGQYVVDKTLNEMYFGGPRPAPFVPDISYKTYITRTPGTSNFTITNRAIAPANGDCVISDQQLRVFSHPDKSFFYYPQAATPTVHAFWSECPSTYILSLRCSSYDTINRRCSLDSIFLGIYLIGSIDDAPIADIAKELCKTTGVKFGAEDLKWFFTHGDIGSCGP